MTTENITSCPVCDQRNFSYYLTTKDYTVTKEEFELIKCSNCNLIITCPRPAPETIGKYYASENYISHSGKSQTLFDKIYLTVRKFTLRWKYQLIKDYFPRPANLLDFGSGTGEFLHYMKGNSWNVFGIEPNDTAREKANHLLGNKVSQDLLFLKNNSIEVITLWHVLEHIHDLNNTIQKLKHLLTPDGLIIIAVPNPQSHDTAHYDNAWAGYDVPRHLWHFSQKTMELLFKKNGLELVDIRPMKLDSFYISLLSEGYKNPVQSKILTGIKALLEGFISNLSAIRSKEYSSLIYIVKSQ